MMGKLDTEARPLAQTCSLCGDTATIKITATSVVPPTNCNHCGAPATWAHVPTLVVAACDRCVDRIGFGSLADGADIVKAERL